MPQLSDIAEKRATKKFTKKEYRPWDLSGSASPTSSPITPSERASDLIQAKAPSQNISASRQAPDNCIEVTPYIDNNLDNTLSNTKTTDKKHLENNEITNRKQIAHIQTTISEHTNNSLGNDLDNDANEDSVEKIRNLTGIQEKIFFYIMDICSAKGQSDTGHIFTSDLAAIANCSIKSAKTSLERLVAKKLLVRKKGKTSKGGYISLHASREIQAAAVQAKNFQRNMIAYTTMYSNSNYLDNEKAHNLVNRFSTSSSINNNINTTTELPEDWIEIDFSPLKQIGFSQSQLLQLYSKQLNTPEIIQESINHFAFGLENNPKVKGYPDPLNVLMGVLRKGLTWVEKNYVSPKEQALRQMLEEKRRQKEQYDAMIKELVDLEFPAWKKSLSEEEIKRIVTPAGLKIAPAMTAELRNYFVEKVLLPKLEKEEMSN